MTLSNSSEEKTSTTATIITKNAKTDYLEMSSKINYDLKIREIYFTGIGKNVGSCGSVLDSLKLYNF
jgi:hypothetical protein